MKTKKKLLKEVTVQELIKVLRDLKNPKAYILVEDSKHGDLCNFNVLDTGGNVVIKGVPNK